MLVTPQIGKYVLTLAALSFLSHKLEGEKLMDFISSSLNFFYQVMSS